VSVAIGDRVLVRDRPWRVRLARPVSEGAFLLELDALDGEVPTSLPVVSPPEDVTPIPPQGLTFDANGLVPWRPWADAHRVIAATLARADGQLAGAVHGRVALEAYQLAPTLRLLSQPRPSLLIADDVGLGKTIEAGLALLELGARGRANRVLIVAPPGLLLQWHEELKEKLGFDFTLIENAAGLARVMRELPAGVNPWDVLPRVLTSMDYLKKDTVRRRALRKRWDVVVVDEAHGLALSGSPRNPYRTQRTRLGEALRDASRGLLLLTATPHNGYRHSFQSLVELVDPTAASFRGEPEVLQRRIGRAMVRRMKSQITRRAEDGSEEPVFPLRRVVPLPCASSPGQQELLAKVASYCARTAHQARGTDAEDLVTFAMQIVKKRALSSRRALAETVEHRLKALRSEDERESPPARSELRDLQAALPIGDAQQERVERRIVRAAIPREERRRKAEIKALNAIRKALRGLDDPDPKIEALVAELEEIAGAGDEKVIVFTEYLDSLAAIRERLDESSVAGAVVVMRGGMTGRQRLKVQEAFERPSTRVLLATDAASEGLNLQRACRRVVHLELPWNPNRLEQRNGRVDRYGQAKPPIIRYLYYPDSPEEDVLHQLVTKIEEMQSSKVSTPDILGVLAGAEEIQAGLVALDPTASDVETSKSTLVRLFDDRTEEFVRSVRPLLAAAGHPGTVPAELKHGLTSATPLLADDLDLEQLVTAVLGRGATPLPDAEGLQRLEVPLELRGPEVAAVYPAATFRRSLAVCTKAADVEFVTPVHPLVRSMAQQARRRFLQVYPDERGLPPQRLAARRVAAGQQPSIAFTFLGATVAGDGQLEERLLTVRLGLDGEPVVDAGGDGLFEEMEPGEVAVASISELVGGCFPSLAARAAVLASAALGAEATRLRGRRTAQAATLRAELDADLADRLAELDEEERRARGLIQDDRQQRLFAVDDGAGGYYRAQRAALETHRQRRLEELARYEEVPEPAPPRPLGAAILVPEGH